jgi:hypothetical protein
MPDSSTHLPAYLGSAAELRNYLDREFHGLSGYERGERFASFVEGLVPLLPIAEGVSVVHKQQHSNDDGVDFVTDENLDGDILCIQSHLTIPDKAEFDSIVSHFQHYAGLSSNEELRLFGAEPEPGKHFVIITASVLDGIVKRYEESKLGSLAFYHELESAGRLTVIDGSTLTDLLRSSFVRNYVAPEKLVLRSERGWLNDGSVSVGVVDGEQLILAYREHGDGLFFENVRDFLGVAPRGDSDESSVNSNIFETATTEPEKMIERNNGITIRGSTVRRSDEDANALIVESPGIVNGCQTTMCIVQAEGAGGEDVSVVVKVVESEDAWDVARAANHQNRVAYRDLSIAQYFRPSLLRRAAAREGVGVSREDAAGSPEALAGLIGSIGKERIAYDDVKYLFMGLYSNRPNQLFQDNYARLDLASLEAIGSPGEPRHLELLEALFYLAGRGRKALSDAVITLSEDDQGERRTLLKPKYVAYQLILALAADQGWDFSDDGRTDLTQSILDGCKHFGDDPLSFRDACMAAHETLSDLIQLNWREGESKTGQSAAINSIISGRNPEALVSSVHQKINRYRSIRNSTAG